MLTTAVAVFVYNSGSRIDAVTIPGDISRNTYFSIHNITQAHEKSKGEGIRVGILDWGFGFMEHGELYSGGLDFTGNSFNFNHVSEHGYWMALVLKEIAPGSEAYALGTFVPDNESAWVDALIAAINWSIENDIDILTLSHQRIGEPNKARFDEAVNRAVEHGIVTTFIHQDNPNNILPFGFMRYRRGMEGYARNPDINIYHYDNISSDAPTFSFSSMSPVTAGFVAMLKSIDNTLAPGEYRNILFETSYPAYFGRDFLERVVDIGNAVNYLLNGR